MALSAVPASQVEAQDSAGGRSGTAGGRRSALARSPLPLALIGRCREPWIWFCESAPGKVFERPALCSKTNVAGRSKTELF